MGSRAAQGVFPTPDPGPWARRSQTGPRRGVAAGPGAAPRESELQTPCSSTRGGWGSRLPRAHGHLCWGPSAGPRAGEGHGDRDIGVSACSARRGVPSTSRPPFCSSSRPCGGSLQPQAQRWWLPGGARDCARAVSRCPSRSAPSARRLHGQPSTCWLMGTPRCLPADTWATRAGSPSTQECPAQAWATSPAQTPASLQLPGPSCSPSWHLYSSRSF